MTALLSVRHVTCYEYDRPVAFGEHRLLVRPRDAHDLHLLDASLLITPSPILRWKFDTFGNSVAYARFSQRSDRLEIRSDLLIRRYAHIPLKHYQLCGQIPFTYSEEDTIDLAPFIKMEFPRERGRLRKWLDLEFRDRPTEIVQFLRALSGAIHNSLNYSRREERGTQSALTTLARKSGTCRDFAFLFMECARLFGFASRFVTGYLHARSNPSENSRGGGSTHAWADVYVPGEGWVEFDPTNLIDGNTALVRIAITRTPPQATPISGTYDASDAKFLRMTVDVSVSEVDEDSHVAA